MLNLVPRSDCTAAREAASARLDGELSELEHTRLDLHLRGCGECRVYARGIEAIAVDLRAAPLERPQIHVSLPRRSRVPLVTAAACFALLAAVAGSLFAISRTGSWNQPAQVATTTSVQASLNWDIAQNHLFAMLQTFEPRAQPHPGAVKAI